MGEIQRSVGVSCEGFEDQFTARLTIIEAAHSLDKKSASKKHGELKKLSWSLNYEGSASSARSKVKGTVSSHEAQNSFLKRSGPQ